MLDMECVLTFAKKMRDEDEKSLRYMYILQYT